MNLTGLVTQLTGLVIQLMAVNNGFLCVKKKKLNNICASIVFKAKTKENYEEEKKV